MGVSAMVPINTRDPAAAARAYLALEWPLALGHRSRPRQGCTCGKLSCGVPGAHPLPQSRRLAASAVEDELRTSLGAGLIARTQRFDAVLVPSAVGMAAMVEYDRRQISPPCIVSEAGTCAMLVLPATGRYALIAEAVEVRTGPEGWIALPPSRGVRWDTLPWYEGTDKPRDLVHGDEIRHVLADSFMVQAGVRSR
ncbi:hypothetical protein [Streptomyces sp. NPDC055692]|uniref:hypothetical protein n=1 Tax=Streptomyces sp. NPDC055692 TaxID=3155683 RepID=UPI0034120D56